MSNKMKKTVIIVSLLIFIGIVVYMAFTYDEVPGADEKLGGVIEEYTQKVGVTERDPFINTDKGDILLFLFAIAGLTSGFYLGYSWKNIVSGKVESGKKNKVSMN